MLLGALLFLTLLTNKIYKFVNAKISQKLSFFLFQIMILKKQQPYTQTPNYIFCRSIDENNPLSLKAKQGFV